MTLWPFPHIDKHNTYAITFLESVIVKIQSPMEKESYQSFSNFIKESFGMDVSQERYNLINADPVRLRNNDRSVVVKFNGEGMEFSISGKGYHNFQNSAMPLINLFRQYIEEIETFVKQISIETIDVWPFPTETVVNASVAAAAFFSKDLIKTLGDPKIIQGKEFNRNNHDSMIIKYGFVKQSPDNPQQPDRLILDEMAIHDREISASALSEVAMRLNDWLYDAFHWAVSDNVLQVMTTPEIYEKVTTEHN